MAEPVRLHLTRSVCLPDPVRLARYRRAPEVGPRVLFFSGGSALNPLCRELVRYTHNSIHVITTFDSGGSSAKLRKAFRMPAVGDVRNRLMALADASVSGNPAVVELFAYRFPREHSPERLQAGLAQMVAGKHPLVAAVDDPMRKIIRNHLRHLQEALPPGFDLRGASVGNLVLSGGYLNSGRHLDPVIFLFSKLAEVRGVVRPVLNSSLHLGARLQDGRTLVGQHLLTGKEVPPLATGIEQLYLSSSLKGVPARGQIREKLRCLIAQAELICFPMGSFFTSLIANLLPDGICRAVAEAHCPKLFIPNPAGDPEQFGMDVATSAGVLLDYLRAGCEGEAPDHQLLNLVLLDSRASYPGGPPNQRALAHMGLTVIDAPLVAAPGEQRFDPELLLGLILSLV